MAELTQTHLRDHLIVLVLLFWLATEFKWDQQLKISTMVAMNCTIL